MRVALRIADNEIAGRPHKLQQVTVSEPQKIELASNQFIVLGEFQAHAEDTDFSVSVDGADSAFQYNSTVCRFEGENNFGASQYYSRHAELLIGTVIIEVSGTPPPTWFLSYLLVTVQE